MKKFIIVSGGCRGEMDEVFFVEAPTLDELVNEMAAEAVGDVVNNYFADDELNADEAYEAAQQEIDEFSIGGCIYAADGGKYAEVGVVTYNEESWCMIVEASADNADELEAFAEAPPITLMHEFEDFIGLDYANVVAKF